MLARMALEEPPRKEEHHEPSEHSEPAATASAHEHAPAAPTESPEKEAARLKEIANVKERLPGRVENSKESTEHAKEHGGENKGHHGKEGHGTHNHSHAVEKGPVSKFFSAVGTGVRKTVEGGAKWYAIVGGGTLFATEGAFTLGAALEGAGSYVASSLGWTQTGTAINAAGQAVTAVGKVLLFNAIPVVLAAGIAVASIFAGGFAVDRLANWLLGTKPQKSAAKAGGDHGAGGGGHGH